MYVLSTGAGWHDTIGRADIVARLPYDVTDLNFWSCNPDDCVVSGKEITWHYEDCEPQGNIEFEIIKPSVWLRVLTETENTRVNANDGEAWGRLAKAYKDAIMTRKGYLLTEWNAATLEAWIACVEQIKLSLDINPDHEGANELLQRISGGDNFIDISGPEPIC